ncbi:MAG: hypothetical protein JNL83_22600 [Myxococcales bacterium]|nr:hypothetical protein [Myxococcales bacterium]
MATIASRLPVLAPALALVVAASCSRASPEDRPQRTPMVAKTHGYPNGYSPGCRSYTAAALTVVNALLIALVRGPASADHVRVESACR